MLSFALKLLLWKPFPLMLLEFPDIPFLEVFGTTFYISWFILDLCILDAISSADICCYFILFYDYFMWLKFRLLEFSFLFAKCVLLYSA